MHESGDPETTPLTSTVDDAGRAAAFDAPSTAARSGHVLASATSDAARDAAARTRARELAAASARQGGVPASEPKPQHSRGVAAVFAGLLLAMFVSNIAPIMILAGAIGLDSSVSAVLIQNCMVIAGISTLVQLYPVWRIGSRLPIVMGISFTFLSLAIAIAGAHGMGTLIGAVIIGGLVEGTLGLFAKYWIKLIPPVVAATVVTAIGFSLLPVGANSFAGGQGAADFGSMNNWVVGSVTLLACLLCQIFAKGFLRSLSVLVGLLVGYVLALFMGMIDFSGLSGLSIVALPKLLPFTPEFNIDRKNQCRIGRGDRRFDQHRQQVYPARHEPISGSFCQGTYTPIRAEMAQHHCSHHFPSGHTAIFENVAIPTALVP